MQSFVSRHVPELDGLRGIAIIAVLVHHQLTPLSLSGGFLGVDLFFVLSGFLITGLLTSEFDQSKTISLRKFYMRRLLRLGPALFVYLLACLGVTYYTKLFDLTTELKLVGLAIAYSTNWRLALGWDLSLDPTAIIWSLSIEEQFYVVWPVVLFACLSLRIRKRFIAIGLSAVVVAIAAHRYQLLEAGSTLTRLYYGTDTRADALLIGCLAALLPANILQSGKQRWFAVAGVFSALFLFYLFVVAEFTDQHLYRGGFTIIAVLAAIVVLVAANSPPWILRALLQLRFIRWFGEISYGLYLWHWLVVRTTSFYYLGYWEPWARLGLAVGIAAASFYLMEKPINGLKKHFSRVAPAEPHLPRPFPGEGTKPKPTVVEVGATG